MSFRYKIRLFSVFIAMIFSVQSIVAQNFVVKAKLDSLAISLGDQIGLTLSVEQPKNERLTFPVFKDKIIDGIDLIEISKLDTEEIVAGRIKVSQKLIITAFEDSIFIIPQFLFRYKSDSLFTDSLLLMVNNPRLDSAELAKIDTSQVLKIFDVKAPIDTPLTFKEFLQRFYIYILIFVAAVVLFFLVRYYLKQRKLNKPLIKLPEKPKEPAHVIALRALDVLKAKKLWQSDQVKLYYTELTEILRAYIENRYNIPTFERTSHEVVESLKHSGLIEKEILSVLSRILSLADLAKFAKYNPLPDENDMCMKNAIQFVQETALNTVQESIEQKNEQELNQAK